MRTGCEHCCETYDEDNLNECARCGDETCWRCAIHAELPQLASGTWWCDRCLKKIGHAQLLKGQRSKARRHFSFRERFLALESLKQAVALSEPGELPWPASDAERNTLTSWLAAAELDVDEDSPDFVVPPVVLCFDAEALQFTIPGYMKLSRELTDKPLWLR